MEVLQVVNELVNQEKTSTAIPIKEIIDIWHHFLKNYLIKFIFCDNR